MEVLSPLGSLSSVGSGFTSSFYDKSATSYFFSSIYGVGLLASFIK